MKGKLKKNKKSILYLKDGEVDRVVVSDDVDFELDYEWAIIADSNSKGELKKLSLINLYKRKEYQEFEIKEPLIHAFKYDISRDTSFLNEYNELSQFFAENCNEKIEFREKTQIKKFIFSVYYMYTNASEVVNY